MLKKFLERMTDDIHHAMYFGEATSTSTVATGTTLTIADLERAMEYLDPSHKRPTAKPAPSPKIKSEFKSWPYGVDD